MPSASAGARQPLDREARRVLANTLGDTPETVISLHVLGQGTCKAFVAGHPARFDGAIVQADDLPTEPVGFGLDPNVLWELLQGVEGWDCILVDSACAPDLGEMMEQELGVRVRYLDDVCHVLTQPVTTYHSQAVRQLTLADLELLASAPPELRASCWDGLDSLLSQGIIACAIVSGQIVATALTAARSQRHADIGVYTHPNHRGLGFATAAASMVAQRVQEAGQIPVWGAGEHNTPSLRVAAKLGFVEVSRRTYVIKIREKRIGCSRSCATVRIRSGHFRTGWIGTSRLPSGSLRERLPRVWVGCRLMGHAPSPKMLRWSPGIFGCLNRDLLSVTRG